MCEMVLREDRRLDVDVETRNILCETLKESFVNIHIYNIYFHILCIY